jgi:hypothetical protein
MFQNACIEQLVGRLPSEELMAKLPSFLLALFDAFDNQIQRYERYTYSFFLPFLITIIA